MRVVKHESELEKAYEEAGAEAGAAFGDSSLYMEKLILNPRHIEVQILGDKKGNIIHLGERDCSMQRRNQKLIEEAPARCLSKSQRSALYSAALKAAGAVNYVNAGTVNEQSNSLHASTVTYYTEIYNSGTERLFLEDLQDLLPERGKNPLWIVLENLQDPGNAGTILRTADACAASGIICTKGTVDFFNPKVIRSCMGSFFHIPFVTVQSIEEAAAFVHENGGMLVGTHLRTSLAYTDVNFRQAAAIVIGNEGSGMSEEAANLCDTLVKIPMPGRAESLNASVAAGVMMYEVLRQR